MSARAKKPTAAAKPTAKTKVAVSGMSGTKLRRAALARQIEAEAASRTADGGDTFAPSHRVRRAAAVEIGCRNAATGNGGRFALYYW